MYVKTPAECYEKTEVFLHIRPESERKLYSTNAIKNISKSQLDLTRTDTEHSTSHSPFIFVIYNCSLIFGNVCWMLTFDGLIVIVQIYLFVRSLWLQFFFSFQTAPQKHSLALLHSIHHSIQLYSFEEVKFVQNLRGRKQQHFKNEVSLFARVTKTSINSCANKE